MLTRESILAVKPRVKLVAVPEWGGEVYIRPLTLAEQAKLGDLGIKHEKGTVVDRMKNGTLALIQWCVCDEDGNHLFKPEDVPTLFNQSVSVFLRLQDEITALSGITKEAREELEKNLLTAQESANESS